jgi:hypothetical protein
VSQAARQTEDIARRVSVNLHKCSRHVSLAENVQREMRPYTCRFSKELSSRTAVTSAERPVSHRSVPTFVSAICHFLQECGDRLARGSLVGVQRCAGDAASHVWKRANRKSGTSPSYFSYQMLQSRRPARGRWSHSSTTTSYWPPRQAFPVGDRVVDHAPVDDVGQPSFQRAR